MTRLPRLSGDDRRALLVGGDLVLVALLVRPALALGAHRSEWEWAGDLDFVASYIGWVAVCGVMWIMLAASNGLYNRRRSLDRWTDAVRVVQTSGQVLILWALCYFVLPPWTLVRHVLVFFTAFAAVAMPLWRLAAAELLRRPALRRRVLIVGAGRAGRTLLDAIQDAAPLDMQAVGFIDDDPALAGTEVGGVPVVGDHGGLVSKAGELGAAEIALAVTGELRPQLFNALMDAREQGLSIKPMPLLYEEITGRVPVEHVGQHWQVALPLDPPEAHGPYRLARRSFDVVFAILGGIVLLLLLPLLWPLVRMSSPGPFLYRQVRVGQGGRHFTLYKLRTMVDDAEPAGPVWAEPDDPRVTAIGRWMRRVRLDELPQVVNILRGQMSVIGPRPERPEFVEHLAREIPFYRARHAVRPGLTGWAAVHQDYAASTDDALRRLQYDLYSIKHQGLLLDATILLRTVARIVSLSGR